LLARKGLRALKEAGKFPSYCAACRLLWIEAAVREIKIWKPNVFSKVLGRLVYDPRDALDIIVDFHL
jgi:hypothetical protein